VLVQLETRGEAHARAVVDRLAQRGYRSVSG
jgi:hypothetical protein